MKRVVILGSTGSIGRSALDVIRRFPDRFRVIGLAAGGNMELLRKQVEEFRPDLVAIRDEPQSTEDFPSRLVGGLQGIREVATLPEADIVLSAISGSAGLLPTLSAIDEGKTIGLANKETLVMAGPLVQKRLLETGARIIPVDSEHSAIYQCIIGHSRMEIRRIILTASGGPFFGESLESLERVGPDDALMHPTWSMGRKITVDSATLMNKGLEVIEAHYLFGFGPDEIDVVIHPQSIVHSLVEFSDGTLLAQLSRPDMKGPIAYALSWPERLAGVVEECGLPDIGSLTFHRPDTDAFPCLRLAYDALSAGGTAPLVLNAANEVAVDGFLKGLIPFTSIPVIIDKVLQQTEFTEIADLDLLLGVDSEARRRAEELVMKG
jgi:1-deoxy-D-xylulose-5-phosphate reductoisomerase